ncbi:GT2 family glycosyltransferase [Skermanella aerolata]|uniref:glycosyltransferase n=1 Tax=Skermanella aerolata TaxID=393310 RepID=UPI003D218C8D
MDFKNAFMVEAKNGLTILCADQEAHASGFDVIIDGNVEVVAELPDKIEPALLRQNQIQNSAFDDLTENWLAEGLDQKTESFGVDLMDDWVLAKGHTAYISQLEGVAPSKAKLVYRDPVAGNIVPVVPGRIYQYSGYFGMHRCDGRLELEFVDGDGTLLQKAGCALESDSKTGGRQISDYFLACVVVKAPANAVGARLAVSKRGTKAGVDSYLFFTRFFFGMIESEADGHVPWTYAQLDAEECAILRCTASSGGFVITQHLPSRFYDGKTHDIAVRSRRSGEMLTGVDHFQFEDDLEGEIERIDGSAVYGWVKSSVFRNAPKIDLYMDGEQIASGVADLPHAKGDYGFSLSLPAKKLDGLVHYLFVRESESGKIVGEFADIVPYQMTPWHTLQKYGGVALPATLSPAANFRYESIQLTLAALADASRKGDQAKVDELQKHVQRLGLLHDKLVAGFEVRTTYDRLDMPYPASPKVSIVVPVHNKFSVTYNCLAALLFAYNEATFEVIVVDDGSSDETLDLAEIAPGVVCVRHETAQGFVDSCNDGAAKARGEYIVMLNNDTEPTARWLDEMLFAFDNFEKVGLVGSKLIYPDSRLQEAGGIVWNNAAPWNYGRGGNPHEPRYNYTRQVDYLSGASVMMPRSLWETVGGFSKEFAPAYYEDTDLAFKVREQGMKVVYAPFSVVYHFEGISNGTSTATTSGLKRFQEINAPKFRRKWAAACLHHGEVGKDLELNKDRNVSYRLLMIENQVPRPDNDAGSYAQFQEMRLLQSLGFKVTFVPENVAWLGAYSDQLMRCGIEVLYAPYYNSIQDVLEARGKEFDAVYITRYNVAARLLPLVRHFAPRAKILFSNCDLHFLREIREAIAAKSQSLMESALKTRDDELSVMRNVDVLLSYNTVEHAVVMSHNLSSTKTVTCPWVVDTIDRVPGFKQRADIAFLGGFGHPPNAIAVTYFLERVMPLLRVRLPGVRFVVYGSGVPKEIRALEADDVVIKGFVKDVRDVYDSCRVFVAPLLTGAGLKGKVIDALAHGTPCVLSPIAAEGTTLRHGSEAMIAESPEEWAESVAKLYSDAALWEKVSASAMDYARTFYSFGHGRKLMRRVLEAIDIFVPDESKALYVTRTRT